MNTKFISAVILAASLALAGCSKPSTTGSAKPAAEPVSIAAIQTGATGFTVGSDMMAHTIYVFYDAECPHCGDLWEAVKPLKSEVQFVWIPVGFLDKASTDQGAAILASKDPAAAMEAHEASMRAHTGGIKVSGDLTTQKAAIKRNSDLLTRFGFDSIPTSIGLNAKTGVLTVQEGESGADAFAKRFGLPRMRGD